MIMKIHLVSSYMFALLSAFRGQDITEYVETVVGLTAELPCNVTSEKPGDKLSVLAWYKNGSKSATYSRDLRDGQEGSGSTEDTRYSIAPDGASLLVDTVRPSDAGLFYCSADFADSPGRKTYVHLAVIEPPQRLWVVHFNGSRIATANADYNAAETIGPYYVGETISLFCVSFGGKPQPVIWWSVDEAAVKNTSTPLSQHRLRSDLALGPLAREDHGRVVSCAARNNDVTRPLVVNVTVDMYLDPELVSIRSPAAAGGVARVRAGAPLPLQCRVLGARPPPAVVWRLGAGQLYNLQPNVTLEPSQRLLVSSVQLSLRREHDEARAACCAVARRRGPDAYVCADPLTVSVVYPPSVEIIPDDEVNNGSVAVLKGSCLRMNCSILANPAIYELTWYHEDEEIFTRRGAEGGEIDRTLEINSVNESDVGAYSCAATNAEGSARSPPLDVDVVYPPFCADDSIAEYGLAENESMNVTCNVRARPAPARYRWLLVGGAARAGSLEGVAGASAKQETEENVLSFVRPNDTAFTTIFCWGINTVELEAGQPSAPCTYWVTDETAPRPPGECGAARGAGGEVTVACERGHDGGLPQKFTLTLISTDSEEQILSITSLEPKFIIQVPTQESFKFRILASNKKGESKIVEISSDEIETEAEDIVQVTNTVADITTLALGLCGGVALVALAACGLVLCAHGGGAGGARAEPPLTAYNTDESNCETCHNSDDESDYHLRRTDSFQRAVARRPRSPHAPHSPRPHAMRRTSSFHAPRCLTDETA